MPKFGLEGNYFGSYLPFGSRPKRILIRIDGIEWKASSYISNVEKQNLLNAVQDALNSVLGLQYRGLSIFQKVDKT